VAGEIEDLYVVPDRRGQSIARRLAQSAIERLRQEGARTIIADADADDRGAHSFWAALGFEGDMIRFALYADE
jgi:ribosomal protein S18 acetylase RimI-like enzyme